MHSCMDTLCGSCKMRPSETLVTPGSRWGSKPLSIGSQSQWRRATNEAMRALHSGRPPTLDSPICPGVIRNSAKKRTGEPRKWTQRSMVGASTTLANPPIFQGLCHGYMVLSSFISFCQCHVLTDSKWKHCMMHVKIYLSLSFSMAVLKTSAKLKATNGPATSASYLTR